MPNCAVWSVLIRKSRESHYTEFMRYLPGTLIPLLLQILFVWLVIEANTGNGSWLGLGVFLIGMFAIPATLIVNALYIRARPLVHPVFLLIHCLAFAFILPIVLAILFVIG